MMHGLKADLNLRTGSRRGKMMVVYRKTRFGCPLKMLVCLKIRFGSEVFRSSVIAVEIDFGLGLSRHFVAGLETVPVNGLFPLPVQQALVYQHSVDWQISAQLGSSKFRACSPDFLQYQCLLLETLQTLYAL